MSVHVLEVTFDTDRFNIKLPMSVLGNGDHMTFNHLYSMYMFTHSSYHKTKWTKWTKTRQAKLGLIEKQRFKAP